MSDNSQKYNLDNIDDEKKFTMWVRSLKSIKSINLHSLILEYDRIEKRGKKIRSIAILRYFHLVCNLKKSKKLIMKKVQIKPF